MLQIAGGILLAVAALAVLVATLRYIVLALSAVFCIAIAAGAWLLLASAIGEWWASAAFIGGIAGLAGLIICEEVWFSSANLARPDGEPSDARSADQGKNFGRKMS